MEVELKKDLKSEELPYIEWYLTSNKSSYTPILFPLGGKEEIKQIETKFGEGASYFVPLRLSKRKKLESLRNCSKDQIQIECASKK